MKLPLEGIRIADLTWAGVGPYCTMFLSYLGAECLKVESTQVPGYFGRVAPQERARYHRMSLSVGAASTDDLHLNKLSGTFNLKHPQGLELAKRLIAISDVVIENFRGGVIDHMGLGYEVVRRVNPAIVMVSISANGNVGPERDGAGFAPIFAALGGASYITGYEGGPPVELRLPSDYISGTMATFATLVGLYRAKATGKGVYVDCANRETLSSFIGEILLDAAMNGRDAGPRGNEDDIMAPHNVYRCEGDDKWVSIAVKTDEEWKALCHATGHPEWMEDQRFSDRYLRWKHRGELDQLIAGWTKGFTHREVMKVLQKAGVAAAPSYSAEDLLTDEHLLERGKFITVENLEGKQLLTFGMPWNFSHTPLKVYKKAPNIGENNGYIFGELLGLSPEDVARLQQERVLL